MSDSRQLRLFFYLFNYSYLFLQSISAPPSVRKFAGASNTPIIVSWFFDKSAGHTGSEIRAYKNITTLETLVMIQSLGLGIWKTAHIQNNIFWI